MKLKDILFEYDFDQENEENEREVAEFDKILQKDVVNVGSVLLWRGVNVDIETFKRFDVPSSREPRDTDRDVNNYIENTRVHDYKGKTISRKGQVIFASTEINEVYDYGNVWIVFVAKKYKAVYCKEDPTNEFFSEMDFNYLDYLLDNVKRMLKSDMITKKFNYIFKLNYPKNLSELRFMISQLKRFVKEYGYNDDTKLNVNELIMACKYIEQNTVEYFDSLYVAEAPWQTGFYEVMIECPYYYLVDEDWFMKNFKYDKNTNSYRRK